MEKPDINIITSSACKAIKLKEKILDRFTQAEYLEKYGLEPGTLEAILEDILKLNYIIGKEWKKVFDKYITKYGINISHFIQFEEFAHTLTTYKDGTKTEKISSLGMRR